ncbi:MAG: diguanylate cyclase [Deltaproteobacteria bacterium]|nr:diguanylate cyclase [Deltaproteobacteria bacterium]
MEEDASKDAATSDALSELARLWRRYEGDPDSALPAITETAVAALRVERASIWLMDEGHGVLRCIDLYEATPGRHTRGTVLRAADYPQYFAALAAEEPIAASDAMTDPRTAEFGPGYLAPLGIGAMLDAPIRLGLGLVGVVCHEHVGAARVWTRAEEKDGAFLASLASLALELSQRARREALLTATLESTGEGILAADEKRVVAFNRRLLDMWGIDRTQIASLALVQDHMASLTLGPSELIAAANEIFAGDLETIDILELRDGRVLERCSRPQVLRDEVVGRVWSFRDVTSQRRSEQALRASEARMRDLAIRDGLTGLFNRRHLLEQLQDLVSRGERLAVAIIDLDHFKRVNDEHGHVVGDAVLRDFAKVVTDRLRASDMIGRYGGEEFALVLRGTGAVQARAVIEGIRRGLAEREPVGGVVRYTFSAGVAELGVDAIEPMALIARADERLYEAKHAGRDRTV